MSCPGDVSREQFELIRSVLEDVKKRTRPGVVDIYDIFNGILYSLKSGCQWRMLPSDYPEWQTVYYYFRLWKETDENGVGILDAALKKYGRQRETEKQP